MCHRLLDLSFNRIKKIENLNHLHKLRKLFLVNNKISEIEDISQLTQLSMLELGANRIRVSAASCCVTLCVRDLHAYVHPLNGPFSGTTWVIRY